jgi:choline-glycine betaine transporter
MMIVIILVVAVAAWFGSQVGIRILSDRNVLQNAVTKVGDELADK